MRRTLAEGSCLAELRTNEACFDRIPLVECIPLYGSADEVREPASSARFQIGCTD